MDIPRYIVQVVPPETVAQQEADYYALRQEWGKATPEQVEAILAKREEVEPEPELKPEVIEKIQQRIREKRKDANQG